MEVLKEKEEVDALQEILSQQEMSYIVKEAVGKLVLAGGNPCFTTKLKKQHDENIISIST